MKKRHCIQLHILDALENGDEMHFSEIFASKPDVNSSTRDYHLRQLVDRGEIERVKNGVFRRLPSMDLYKQVREARQKFSSAKRSAENNEETINILLNTYDEVLAIFRVWVLEHIASEKIDFEKQLLFIENLKWLTVIGDKLMKRWSLEHVGYDTNTRQAQEDAKAKTAEREKEALKDAPLEDTLTVVGHFHEDLKQLWDKMPPSQKEEEEV